MEYLSLIYSRDTASEVSSVAKPGYVKRTLLRRPYVAVCIPFQKMAQEKEERVRKDGKKGSPTLYVPKVKNIKCISEAKGAILK